ncbi:hypothetical protein GCM10022261_12960 [Brevibacterium daeguense]|uniref:Uncharacterized protein n=2 Tax=Brevibacterium daeguense TaxID=909936 RepID=A0ABP8EIL1_9MICO
MAACYRLSGLASTRTERKPALLPQFDQAGRNTLGTGVVRSSRRASASLLGLLGREAAMGSPTATVTASTRIAAGPTMILVVPDLAASRMRTLPPVVKRATGSFARGLAR